MASNTITSFTAGDLVVSLSGEADGTTTYTDNQGTPLTLEELAPSAINPTGAAATDVGGLVLPQNPTTNANGVTESAISAEYGSSSEGTLELSQDGTSLVIAGYGVNAAAYNNAEAAYQPTTPTTATTKSGAGSYGANALAQTYSVPSGPNAVNGTPNGDITVPRVIADIGANGTVDTSTSLVNVDNENNPRSVATTNGQSFYISGQGVKGDTTQGVFLATDGQNGTTPTPIYNGVDTRTAVLYNNGTSNNTLYVSEDSSQAKGTGGIYSYGTSPTASTTPTILPGMTGNVTLANGDGNNVNNSSGTVDMSPENFFFANPTTLYIADSGNPKGGTAGDGGLQKWTETNGSWNLDYTLSAGLNLVPNSTAPSTTSTNTTGYGANATTGLIGLTGQVNNVTGTVSLYATNATVGDLNNTYVYGISDTLGDTKASQVSGESFSQLYQAPADTNVRGIAFAPQAAAVTCFASNTCIRTARGDVAVEHLHVGDLAVTASGEARPIRWIGHRTVDCRRHPRPQEAMPVRIAAHALGDNRPARDLRVSPGHAICLDLLGEILVPAVALVNGATVTQDEVDSVTYWHVELDTHDILLAENLAAESYLDVGNRSFFAEADVTALDASPDAPMPSTADYCRPFHPIDSPLVAVVRDQLRQRAKTLGWSIAAPEAPDDLWLEVDGHRVDPARDGLVARAILPATAREVFLCSSVAVPAFVLGAADGRKLGIKLAGLVVDDGLNTRREIGSDDARLADGFHADEGTHRWSDGRARLPAELWAGVGADFVLRIALAGPALPTWVAPAMPRIDEGEVSTTSAA